MDPPKSITGKCWHPDFDFENAIDIEATALGNLDAPSLSDSHLAKMSDRVLKTEPILSQEKENTVKNEVDEGKTASVSKVSSLLERVRQRNLTLSAHKSKIDACQQRQTRRAQLSRCLELCDIIKEYLFTIVR